MMRFLPGFQHWHRIPELRTARLTEMTLL